MPVAGKKDVASAVTELTPKSAAYTYPPSEREPYPQPEKTVSVLAISPCDEDHVFLGNIFSHSKWHIRGVRCWRDALAHLSEHRTPVVVCERDLPDCTWREVLSELARFPDPPLLVVTSRLADEHLWAEVLNLGGYDVLMKPFDQTEVIRVIGLAWLNWKNSRERNRRAAPRIALAAGM
jgi:DNA-binding response OmpR family regulator